MAKVIPFNGLIPSPDKVSKVAAVPYDVVNSEEAAKLAEGNPLSFLRVSKPEIELDKGLDHYDDKVYIKAVENFRRLCKTAPLLLDKQKHLYIYSLKMGEHVQTGIVAAVSVEDYDGNIIKKHEKTRKDKEDDRTKHIYLTRSHSGPVFLTYKDVANIDGIVTSAMTVGPLFNFTASDGISHKLWRLSDEQSGKLSELFDKIPFLYIADGHHRAASAARVGARCKNENPNHTGKEDYNYFLAVIFPSSQLRILPYNRVAKDLNGLSSDEFMKKVSAKFAVSPSKSPSPDKQGEFCMLLEGNWYNLKPLFDTSKFNVIDCLDVSVLQNYILNPILGIEDPRTSKRIDFVGGIRGTGELEKLLKEDKAKVAFSMYPTTVKQMMDIADAGEIMPPKSTWFEPKLRDGLVCHNF
ncbi:MAG: hypothetical protein A2X48_17935 [Lentisphaerae bacterium GWF2_49_21]|nr:MAG: hypothetical protein A2X48_17935 [Lentisphaerae bacterium GWF2_49_21]